MARKDWHQTRLKYVADIDPSPYKLRHLADDTPVSFVPMDAVGELGTLDLSRERPIGSVADGYTYFAEGDVIVAKITPCFENGKGAIALGLTNGIAFGTTELVVLRPRGRIDPRFLYYITAGDEFRKPAAAQMYGAGGQKRVPQSFFRDFRMSLPPIEEQKAIAAFLDRETARIDALIHAQRRCGFRKFW